MQAPIRLSTTVSTKGQVILPSTLRRALRWEAGTKLIVESTPEGVLLRSAQKFVETRPEDVFRRLAFEGTPKSLNALEAGIMDEAKRRHAGD